MLEAWTVAFSACGSEMLKLLEENRQYVHRRREPFLFACAADAKSLHLPFPHMASRSLHGRKLPGVGSPAVHPPIRAG
eukprot:134311-Pyramimonas_sp.AAC.2